MRDIIEGYTGYLLMQGRSANTVRAYRPKLAGWIDWCLDAGIDWRDFDPNQIAAWSRTRAPGRATRAQCAAAIAMAAEWQGGDREVGRAVDCPKRGGKPRWRGLDADVVSALLAAADDAGGGGTALYVGLYTGMRVSEIVELRWEDIDLDRGRLIAHRDKVDDWHVLPIHGDLADRLELRHAGDGWVFPGRNGGHVAKQTVRDWFAVLCKEAGVERITPHQLRHTAAVALYESTDPRDPLLVQRFLGHTNVQTTMTYLHVGIDAVAGALSRVSWRG